jgi:hypothetical protein
VTAPTLKELWRKLPAVEPSTGHALCSQPSQRSLLYVYADKC